MLLGTKEGKRSGVELQQHLNGLKAALPVVENDLSFRNEFDDLAIAAPARSLSAIVEKLDVKTAASVVGTLAKDLAKIPDQELWEHIRHWIRSAHRIGL